MATTIITGRDVTFTLDSATYDAQATSAVLSCETIIETYQTLDGALWPDCRVKLIFNLQDIAIQLLILTVFLKPDSIIF